MSERSERAQRHGGERAQDHGGERSGEAAGFGGDGRGDAVVRFADGDAVVRPGDGDAAAQAGDGDAAEWVDDLPVVRSYAMTRGRARAGSSATLGLTSVVDAVAVTVPYGTDLGIEHRRLLGLLSQPKTLAELASEAGLPLGVVRVLLGDLLDHGLARVRPPGASSRMESLLQEVISGLRAL
ncbi:DUF742 domain-containing protein [Microbispora sp. NPDC049125]|uniref:DUF742 domain-containing protein n=1 Tax=Microbispora sp. NPDC049125 TaxID=3154929 RepID=UPI0034652BB2